MHIHDEEYFKRFFEGCMPKIEEIFNLSSEEVENLLADREMK